jgi:predicted AAA+ superfamily ATPase
VARDLFFWRTRSGVEVDFVLYGPDGLWALEVKNSRKVHSVDLRSLLAFREDYPRGKTLLVYRGSDRLLVNDVLCLPCSTFLAGLRPDQSLDIFFR